MNRRTVLVSGASVAGPAVAYWLGRAGWDVTVVERFDGLREGGQNVDVRGTGREVVRRMGLEDAVRSHHTRETAMTFVSAAGRPYASFPADAGDHDSPTADLEILRGQLSQLLFEKSEAHSDYLFGDEITGVHDDGSGVDVQFAGAAPRRYDAVVVAEGSRSHTRDLVMPDAQLDDLGMLWSYFTIPRTSSDDRSWRLHLGGEGRVVHLRPDNVGTTRAMLSLRTDVRGLHLLPPETMRDVLREAFGGLGWQTDRILDAMDGTTPYVDVVAQVRLPRWHRGRIVMLGDAAWNAGPFGTGTTSALTGAYLLAGELSLSPQDPSAAFRRYEQSMRPMTDNAQKFVPYNIHPRTPRQQRLLDLQLRAMSSRPGRALGSLLGFSPSPPVDQISLPDQRFYDFHASENAS